jgi:formamidopyrimidine-DNA glycosylase
VRRGKFLWLTCDDPGTALVIHLGMSGQMLVDQRFDADAAVKVLPRQARPGIATAPSG